MKHKANSQVLKKKIRIDDYVDASKISSEPDEGLVRGALGIEVLAYAHAVYPRIDPAFLSIKHPNKYDGIHVEFDLGRREFPFKLSLPRFAIYTPDSPICELEPSFAYRDERLTIVTMKENPELPEVLFDNLSDAFKTNLRYRGGNPHSESRIMFTSVFDGFIPKETKRNLKVAENIFGRQLYIVAEAKNWQGKPIPIVDPLILGHINNECFLVSQFNCTPVEDYVKREFKE